MASLYYFILYYEKGVNKKSGFFEKALLKI